MLKIIDGKRISQEIKDELKAEAAVLKERGIEAALAAAILPYMLYGTCQTGCTQKYSSPTRNAANG